MDVFLDTSLIVPLIIETDKTEVARNFFNSFDFTLVTNVSVYEETFYVGVRILAEDRLNIKNPYTLREYIKKNGYNFAEDFVTHLHDVFNSIDLIVDVRDLELIRRIAETYKLLPNDALIAATCKHYGIKKIASFDEDFNRIDFLEVVEIE